MREVGDPHARPQDWDATGRPTLGTYVVRMLLPSVVIVLVGACLGFTCSAFFAVRWVDVRAPDRSLAQEVAGLIHLNRPLNCLWSPVGKVAAQVRQCRRVKAVTIIRALPDRWEVHVTPRPPAFALETEGKYLLVDNEGVLLYRTGRPIPGLPVVRGLDVGKSALGGQLSPYCLEMIHSCISGAQQAGMGLGFVLDITTPFEYTLRTPAGTELRLGGADNLARKIIIGATVERHVLKRNLKPEFVDVRLPTGEARYKARGPQAAAARPS